MAKVKIKKFTAAEKDQFLENLGKALLKQKDIRPMKEFLRKIFTPSEIVMMGRRLQTAQMLLDGKSYREIREINGIGLGTVQFVDSWLRQYYADFKYAPVGKRKTKPKKSKKHYYPTQRSFGYSVGPNPYFRIF